MASQSRGTDGSSEALSFLGQRVARYGFVVGALNGFLVLSQAVFALLMPELTSPLSFLPTVISMLTGFGVWRLALPPGRSRRFLRVLEVLGFLIPAYLFIAAGASSSAVGKPELTITLALTLGLIARSIYVPSTPQLTLGLATAIALPLVVVCFLIYRDITQEALDLLHGTYHDMMGEPRHGHLSASNYVYISTLYAAVWWMAASGVAVATSHVVYGLRREVHNKRRLGQYLLERRLGEGGMGVVYEASHALLRRRTAIKLLPPERAGAETIARFEREVRRTAELTHPNTVTVFDYGRTPEGLFYYAMELLEGVTLEEAVELSGPQEEARVVHVLGCVAGALAEAHAVGLIHRDIKPQNIMLCERQHALDVVKVLDFGLVKELDRDRPGLSDPNGITGTPLYMAPEAIHAPDRIDARSDVYALGAVGYYLLTGEHVFHGATIVEICSHHLHSVPKPPHERLGRPVTSALEALILACLRKDPKQRPDSARTLLSALGECGVAPWTDADAAAWWGQHGPSVRARRAASPASQRGVITVALEGIRHPPGET